MAKPVTNARQRIQPKPRQLLVSTSNDSCGISRRTCSCVEDGQVERQLSYVHVVQSAMLVSTCPEFSPTRRPASSMLELAFTRLMLPERPLCFEMFSALLFFLSYQDFAFETSYHCAQIWHVQVSLEAQRPQRLPNSANSRIISSYR